MKRKSALRFASALVMTAMLGIGAASQAAPVLNGAAIGQAAPQAYVDVQWGWGPGPYYYGPRYRPRYYGPPVYAVPPPIVYERPPVVFEPPPVTGGPVRQCWIDTDKDRGYGFWRPC